MPKELKEKIEDWEKWKSFFDWINQLSPWNLWHPHDYNKSLKERRLNPKIEDCFKDLLSQEKQKWVGEEREKRQKEGWGCAYCNILNYSEASYCMNCGKKKKVGSPFHFSF